MCINTRTMFRIMDAAVSLAGSLLAITGRVVQATARITTLQSGSCHRDRPKGKHRRQQHRWGPPWLPPPPLLSSPSPLPHNTLPDRAYFLQSAHSTISVPNLCYALRGGKKDNAVAALSAPFSPDSPASRHAGSFLCIVLYCQV
nr:uncharacterized protein LOC109769439 isoform X2 [Aegilops tauschii subsp. strangulata]